MGSLRVKFWGTRGLFSSPRPETAIFGGNTACLQILYKDHLILVDTGFGAANLGDTLPFGGMTDEKMTAHIFYTHFHWDHVQGLPFFKPIYSDRTVLKLYSPERTARMLENLNVLFDGSYSPFESLLGMQAEVQLHQLTEELDLDGLKIEYHAVDHGPHHDEHGETYAYKFTAPDGASVCLVTDHEARKGKRNDAVVAFAKNCDILIHDGQFRDEEYEERIGWGHSSARMALENARRIDPGLTLLTHHDPGRDDRDLQRMHRELLQDKKLQALQFEFAREEIVYEVAKTGTLPKVG